MVATAAITIPELRNYGRLDIHDHDEVPKTVEEPQAETLRPAEAAIAPTGDSG